MAMEGDRDYIKSKGMDQAAFRLRDCPLLYSVFTHYNCAFYICYIRMHLQHLPAHTRCTYHCRLLLLHLPYPPAFEVVTLFFGLSHREGLTWEHPVMLHCREQVPLVHRRQVKAHYAGL